MTRVPETPVSPPGLPGGAASPRTWPLRRVSIGRPPGGMLTLETVPLQPAAVHDGVCAVLDVVTVPHADRLSGVRGRLTAAPCAGGPARIQVNLRIDGMLARIEAAAPSLPLAVTQGARRLQRQIDRMLDPATPWPWPDPDTTVLSAPSLAGVPGTIARVKTIHLEHSTVATAVYRLWAMDYQMHLFTDIDTGQDAVVYRAGPTGVRLARQHSHGPPAEASTTGLLPIVVRHPHPVAVLPPSEAGEQLVTQGLAVLFFTDPRTGRGNLVYRRHDAQLTLLRPSPRPSAGSAG